MSMGMSMVSISSTNIDIGYENFTKIRILVQEDIFVVSNFKVDTITGQHGLRV